MFSGGTWHDTPIYNRADLQAGDEIDGPAIIAEPNQTIVVEPDWRDVLTRADQGVITRSKRWEERRVGKEGVDTGRDRWRPEQKKKTRDETSIREKLRKERN